MAVTEAEVTAGAEAGATLGGEAEGILAGGVEAEGTLEAGVLAVAEVFVSSNNETFHKLSYSVMHGYGTPERVYY